MPGCAYTTVITNSHKGDIVNYRFIPTKVHGVFDYVGAIALVFAPTIFMFNNVGGAAVIIPVVLGFLLFLYSLFTRYELGVIRLIGFPIHLAVDFIAAAFLALSPFLFGFIHDSPNVWLPHVVVGILVILIVLFSKTQPTDPLLRVNN
jgi:hypothetical protein